MVIENTEFKLSNKHGFNDLKLGSKSYENEYYNVYTSASN